MSRWITAAIMVLIGASMSGAKYAEPISKQEMLDSRKEVPEDSMEKIMESKISEQGDINLNATWGTVLDPSKAEDRVVVKRETQKWPNKTIPYKITEEFDKKERLYIARAMDSIQRHSCVRFVDASDEYIEKGGDFVEICKICRQEGKCHFPGCWSMLGRTGMGKQQLQLYSYCFQLSTVIHELMHAMGFYHEHNRKDRDEYVDIKFENIEEGKQHNFKKVDDINALTIGEYDYCSLMHYQKTAFSVNGNITIRVLKSDKKCADSIGLTKLHLTDNDIRKINTLYECGRLPQVDNDIPVKERICHDMRDDCGKLACGGICFPTHESYNFYKRECAKTCNVCSDEPPPELCCNRYSDYNCKGLADQGYCEKMGSLARSGCKKTCNLCDGKTKTDYCADMFGSEMCANTACKKPEKDYMASYCRKTAGMCGSSTPKQFCCNAEKDQEWCDFMAAIGKCEKGNGEYVRMNCVKSCNLCGDKTKTDVCLDAKETWKCQTAACDGQCFKGAELYEDMQMRCRKTCNFCNGGVPPQNTSSFEFCP